MPVSREMSSQYAAQVHQLMEQETAEMEQRVAQAANDRARWSSTH